MKNKRSENKNSSIGSMKSNIGDISNNGGSA